MQLISFLKYEYEIGYHNKMVLIGYVMNFELICTSHRVKIETKTERSFYHYQNRCVGERKKGYYWYLTFGIIQSFRMDTWIFGFVY